MSNFSDLNYTSTPDLLTHNYFMLASTWINIILTATLGLIIMGTVIGNASVLLHFWRGVRKRSLEGTNPTHFFIANLSLADLLVGVVVLPFLASLQVQGRWNFGQCFCTVWVCTHFWLCAASILSTTAICVERFIGVRYPIAHMRILTVPRILWSLVGVWLLAAIPSFIRVFAWTEPKIEIPGKCIINQKLGHCLVATIGIFYTPATLMTILYFLIYRIARRHIDSKRTGIGSSRGMTFKVSVGGSSSSSNSTDVSNLSSKREAISNQKPPQSIQKRQINIAMKLGILVGVVILSYGPYFTLILIKSVDETKVSPKLFDFFSWIRYSNSFFNPMIYAFCVPDFNRAFKKSWVGQLVYCRRK